MAHFTPGPWSFSDGYEGGYTIWGERPNGPGVVIASRNAWGSYAETSKANGRLIATAPELYVALAELDDALTDALCNDGLPDFDKGRLDRARDQARAALAKASPAKFGNIGADGVQS